MPSAPPGAETTYMATIPAEAAIPPNVDYYIQAVDTTGNVLAQRGDTDAPLRIPIPTEEKTSVAKKWWFWTIIGVVVIGVAGGIAGGVIASQDGGGGSGTAGVSIIICEPGVDC